jgi:glycerol-3-phosphate dehydrogenase
VWVCAQLTRSQANGGAPIVRLEHTIVVPSTPTSENKKFNGLARLFGPRGTTIRQVGKCFLERVCSRLQIEKESFCSVTVVRRQQSNVALQTGDDEKVETVRDSPPSPVRVVIAAEAKDDTTAQKHLMREHACVSLCITYSWHSTHTSRADAARRRRHKASRRVCAF